MTKRNSTEENHEPKDHRVQLACSYSREDDEKIVKSSLHVPDEEKQLKEP